MPYQADLKRPDLKGEFPCTVCGRVFCHSSSLSRHRIQAHFSNYRCTLCNQEISSNESLRSHMSQYHQVNRVFMCRCCNWAFPDKMNLHIHIANLTKSGTPGQVTVLARSFGENDESSKSSTPESTNLRSSSVSTREESTSPPKLLQSVPQQSPIQFGHSTLSHPLYLQAFLQQLEQMKSVQQHNLKQELNKIPSNSWIENNHFVQNQQAQQKLYLLSLFQQLQSRNKPNISEGEPPAKKLAVGTECPSVAELNVNENTIKTEMIEKNIKTEIVENSETIGRKNKRKSKKPQHVVQIDSVEVCGLLVPEGGIFENQTIESTQQSESSSSTTISEIDSAESVTESQELFKNDKISDYIQRLNVINDLISKFINLVEKENFEQEKQSVLEIAFQILKQCVVK